jgi:ParB-like chromosome segregation protein Spo0J
MKTHKYKIINISDCLILERNPQFLSEKTMAKLKESINQDGFVSPILVCPEGNKYRIVSGNHRFLAAKELNLKTIPAVIGNFTKKEIQKLALNLNFVHGNPPAELVAPFLSDLSKDVLEQIYIPDDLQKELEKVNADFKSLADNEIPNFIDDATHSNNFETCVCPKCGKRHVQGKNA